MLKENQNMSYARKSSTLPVLFHKMLDMNFFSQSIVYDCVILKFIVFLNVTIYGEVYTL